MFRRVSDQRPLTPGERTAWDYSRRQFFGHAGISLAGAAAATLGAGPLAGSDFAEQDRVGGLTGIPHFQPRARREDELSSMRAKFEVDKQKIARAKALRLGRFQPY